MLSGFSCYHWSVNWVQVLEPLEVVHSMANSHRDEEESCESRAKYLLIRFALMQSQIVCTLNHLYPTGRAALASVLVAAQTCHDSSNYAMNTSSNIPEAKW